MVFEIAGWDCVLAYAPAIGPTAELRAVYALNEILSEVPEDVASELATEGLRIAKLYGVSSALAMMLVVTARVSHGRYIN